MNGEQNVIWCSLEYTVPQKTVDEVNRIMKPYAATARDISEDKQPGKPEPTAEQPPAPPMPTAQQIVNCVNDCLKVINGEAGAMTAEFSVNAANDIIAALVMVKEPSYAIPPAPIMSAIGDCLAVIKGEEIDDAGIEAIVRQAGKVVMALTPKQPVGIEHVEPVKTEDSSSDSVTAEEDGSGGITKPDPDDAQDAKSEGNDTQ